MITCSIHKITLTIYPALVPGTFAKMVCRECEYEKVLAAFKNGG